MKNENLGTEADTLDDSHGFLANCLMIFFETHRVISKNSWPPLIVSIHADYCKTSEEKSACRRFRHTKPCTEQNKECCKIKSGISRAVTIGRVLATCCTMMRSEN